MDLMLYKPGAQNDLVNYYGSSARHQNEAFHDMLIGEEPEHDQPLITYDPWLESLEDELFLFTEDAPSTTNCHSSMTNDALVFDHSLPEKKQRVADTFVESIKSPEKRVKVDFDSNHYQRSISEEHIKPRVVKRQRVSHYNIGISSSHADEEFQICYSKAPTSLACGRDGTPVYLCPFPGCSYKARTLETMNQHMDLHQDGKKRNFKCETCGDVFYSSGCLTSHMITHTRGGETNYNCNVKGCGKRYATAEGLRLHTRNHHQVNKTWKCMSPTCTISFVRKSDLQMHILRMHTMERPYPCQVDGCLKSFACHSELRRHMYKLHNAICPKLSKEATEMNRPKSDEFERLLTLASLHRDKLKKARAEAKAKLMKERKAQLKALRAKERMKRKEAKKAKASRAASRRNNLDHAV